MNNFTFKRVRGKEEKQLKLKENEVITNKCGRSCKNDYNGIFGFSLPNHK